MKKAARAPMIAFGAAVAAVTITGAAALARPGGGIGDPGIMCPDVWMPVLCPDGKIYSNHCYAARAGQTGCTQLWGPIPVPM